MTIATCLRTRPRQARPGIAAAATAGMLPGLLCLLLALSGATDAAAQAATGPPSDLQFVVRDATTGQTGTPDRVTIDYVLGTPNNILDMKPGAGDFTAPAVPVKDIGTYIVTVWYQGVPYWWQKLGSDLTAGPVTLDVFSTTVARDMVAIKGLNLVVQHRQTTAALELLAEVTNLATPQATVSGGSVTLELPLPAGATDVKASYLRGPEPTPVEVTVSGTRALLKVPLTPGSTRVHLTATAPWKGVLEIPVGSDLAVESWSLLTTPVSVGVDAVGLKAPDEAAVPNYARRAGPAIEAGSSVVVRLTPGTAPGAPEPLFSEPAPMGATGSATSAAKNAKGGGFPLPLAAALVVVIIGALVLVRRGRS
jgi:hypothetical protein